MADQDSVASVNSLRSLDAELQSQVATAVGELSQRIAAAYAAAEARIDAMKMAVTSAVDLFDVEARKAIEAISIVEKTINSRSSELFTDEAELRTLLDQADDALKAGLAALTEATVAQEAAGVEFDERSHAGSATASAALEVALEELSRRIEMTLVLVGEASEALETLSDGAARCVSDIVEELATLAQHASKLLDEVRGAIQTAAEEGAEQIGREVAKALADVAAAAQAALGSAKELQQLADALGDSFSEAVEQVTSVIRQVISIIDVIRPVLDLAKQLA